MTAPTVGQRGRLRISRDDAAAGLAGAAAGAVTVGTGTLLTLVAGPSSDPLVAVGSAFVDATPGWLRDWAVAVLGTADKFALGIGEVLVLAALAALAGVLARRSWTWGAVLVVALGGLAALAATTRPDAGPLAPVPALAGAAAGLFAMRALVGRLPTPPTGRTDRPVDAGPDRRAFLRATALVATLGVLGAVVGRVVTAGARGAEAVREALRLPVATRPAPVPPAAVSVGVEGVEPWATPPGDFYRIDTALVVPQVDPARWRLRVHGMVEQEVEIGWDELLASDLVEAWVTLACVSNPVGGGLVGNQRWLGLPVREVLARAVPAPDADMVLSRSVDGFTASTPIEAFTDDRDALLAIAMDGEPLPPEHGFPVRLVVPGLYGYVSATKWVTELEVTRFERAEAYWTTRGWWPRGPVKTQSRIEVPRPGADVPAGDVVVAGTAWAQHRGVERVQVRVDDGPWQDCDLAADGGIDTWRQWRWAWRDAPTGEHLLAVRAWDPDGPQTGVPTAVVPDGASGYDTLTVTVT
ncbi:molybdopterin-dependent oxidoreductase [Cellulomonas xiejunii]|uniref:Molybdopterin-dependent oxidoreductase n=1 Tax=Cellulomonas xiejunii TaxID=2968083 RepID=A0ABY5KUZ9_9CELL|nr:molybdopterin-dependent oxidoreductase [Cellulomonas xiejunii]MCC2323037.1 molybdopterin-dependent oxidoreductase [Cellulomonas xiejunii]UUI73533.1 molybdopterin-dependent oxidoreductase [Cellulomonas xiejunii]